MIWHENSLVIKLNSFWRITFELNNILIKELHQKKILQIEVQQIGDNSIY